MRHLFSAASASLMLAFFLAACSGNNDQPKNDVGFACFEEGAQACSTNLTKVIKCEGGIWVQSEDCAEKNQHCENAACVEGEVPDTNETKDEAGSEGTADSASEGTQTEAGPDIDTRICNPGETQPCYQGPTGTKGVGECKEGVSTCNQIGSGWTECTGQVLPKVEVCMNGKDENCDGVDGDPATVTDIDGDGFTYCTGDCCEIEAECPGANPKLVAPGGFDAKGNGVDDNCNGTVDEVATCDEAVSVSKDAKSSATSLAKAMGICEPWIISADLTLTGTPVTESICDGANTDDNSCVNRINRPSKTLPYYDDKFKTYAVPEMFGKVLSAKEGKRLAVLSTGDWDFPTGNARDATLEAGDMKTASNLPTDWINKQPGCEAPRAPSCGGQTPDPNTNNSCNGQPGPAVQDPIMLTVKLKVPINAVAFRFKNYFCSIEYPNTVCSSEKYNDFFFALLDSTYNEKNPTSQNLNPYDKNLAKDDKGNPIGVDLAPAGLFKVCNQNCKAMGGLGDTNKWGFCTGDQELAGTGFQSQTVMGSCSGNGCTGWLTTQGNVVPGEEITLRLATFEQGTVAYGPDHSWDSTVLLDSFEWLNSEQKPGTSIQE